MKYTKQLFVYKISWLIRFQSQNILIYFFIFEDGCVLWKL